MDWSDRIGRRIKLRDLHIVLAVAEMVAWRKLPKARHFRIPSSPRRFPSWSKPWASGYSTAILRGVKLTTYGQALLKCGVNVFDEMRQGLKQIEFLADPTSGELAVGCPEIIIAGILPALAERFLRQYPACSCGHPCRYRAHAIQSVARAQRRIVDRADTPAVYRRRSDFGAAV